MLDSCYRGYPIGSILLWKPPGNIRLDTTPLEINTNIEKKRPLYIILDGQQRLLSLYKTQAGEISISFDLETESFCVHKSKLKGNPHLISVADIFTKGSYDAIEEFFNLNQTHSQKRNKYKKMADKIEQIKNYGIPVIVIDSANREEILETFIRINSKGTRLKKAEIELAIIVHNWPEFVNELLINEMTYLQKHGFDLEPRFLVRCFVATATGKCTFDDQAQFEEQAYIQKIWKKTKNGIRFTINLLNQNLGIDSEKWIPSFNALIPIVFHYTKSNGRLKEGDERVLIFWYLATTLFGRYSGGSESKIEKDLNALSSEEPFLQLIKNLKHDIPNMIVSTDQIRSFSQHAIKLLMFSVFRSNESTDWFTGVALNSTGRIGSENQIELHHIFPKALLQKEKKYSNEQINDLANIAFLSQKANRDIRKSKPNEYLDNIPEERLKAQCIPLQKELWHFSNNKKDIYAQFLQRRRELIAKAINNHLKKLGGEYYNLFC